MDVNEIDRVKDVLCSTTLLVAVCELANSDRDIQARQVCLGQDDLFCKLLVREDVVEQRLRAKLNAASDKLGEWVGVKGCEKGVSSRFPNVAAVKTEL